MGIRNKIPLQTDIVIDREGKIHFSFLRDDFLELAGVEALSASRVGPSIDAPSAFRRVAIPIEPYRSCRLCPRRCGFDRVKSRHPRCGDFRLRVSTFGISLGDEPVIRGTRGSGTIMLSGCPLHCPSCHNPEMVSNGEPVEISDFVSMAWEMAQQGAHNLQILSPTVHFPALRVALGELRAGDYPLPVILKSSGFELPAEIEECAGLVDVYLPDLKYGPCSQWAERAGARNYFETALDSIVAMRAQVGPAVIDADGILQKGVLVRHVLAPLPEREKNLLLSALSRLEHDGVLTSLQDGFVDLENLA